MDNLSQAPTAISINSSTIQAMAHLATLASLNSTVSSHGWSVVCPNHSSCYSLEDIVASGADMRTVDYIFPMTQAGPNGTPPTCVINIFTKNPQVANLYSITAVLFTCSGLPEESRIVFEGVASMEPAVNGGMIVSGHCSMVPDTGGGIFAGALGGRATFKNFWNLQITQTPPPGSELSGPGLRLRPVQWSFLLGNDVAGTMRLALSRAMT